MFCWALVEQVREQEQFIDEEIEHYWTCFDVGIKAQILGWTCKLVPDALVVDAGFDIDSHEAASAKAERLKQESRLALNLKYMPCELLPEALTAQLAGSAARMVKRGKGDLLAQAFRNLDQKRASLLTKRSHWGQLAARRGVDVVTLLRGPHP